MKDWTKYGGALTTGIFLLALVTVVSTAHPGDPVPPHWGHFGFGQRGSNQKPIMNVPEVTLNSSEWDQLEAGEPVTRLIDSPGEYKIGYLRFFAPFDPVTAWMVVTDYEHYDLVDPSFDLSGSITEKRRTFWPNAFENNVCVNSGEYRVSQLIVAPFLKPRKLCLVATFTTDSFPWEAHLDIAGVTRCCEDRSDPALRRYFEKAVGVLRNKESWFISPLSASFKRSKADALRADCVYVADVNPGGELGRFDFVAKAATTMSLPQLAKHVVTYGRRWERFLLERYGEKELDSYREWLKRYRQATEGGR